MKTVEERAKEYVERHGGRVANHCFGFGRSYRMAYEAGAIEQKAIDIEKACKVYRDELQRLKTQLDESVGVPANLVSVDKSLSRIAKEMLYENN